MVINNIIIILRPVPDSEHQSCKIEVDGHVENWWTLSYVRKRKPLGKLESITLTTIFPVVPTKCFCGNKE